MVDRLDKIWMDGALVDWDDAKVHILTHTLHYGLGAFEGIRCYRRSDGRSAVFRLQEHVDRLRGARAEHEPASRPCDARNGRAEPWLASRTIARPGSGRLRRRRVL